MVIKKYDVVVVGGGVSGSIAAIAAARAGAKTMVAERYGFMGGMLTNAGVGPMMSFHAGEKQIVKGIPDEIIESLKAVGASTGHIDDTIGFASSLTPFDPEGMKYILEHKLMKAGGDILYHSFFTDCTKEGKKIRTAQFWTKSGLVELEAKTFIDATGDADLSVRAGVGYAFGRSRDGLAQPMTMKARVGNVNIEDVKSYMKAHPDEFMLKDQNCIDNTARLSVSGFFSKVSEAKENGDLTYPRDRVLFFQSNNPNEVIVNMTRIPKLDATDSFQITKGEIEGREQVAQTISFLKKYIPGFGKCYLISTGPQIGVRETRRIKGIYTLTADEMLDNVMFDDAVAMGGYPIDIHSPDGTNILEKHFTSGSYYSIPYRTMVTNEVDNLVVTGRCISAEHEASASLRVTPIAMALGQAAGAAAAISAVEGKAALDISINQLKRTLLEQGAYLSEYIKA